MLRPDLKAAAQLAWQNFVARTPGGGGAMTEEDYLLRVEEVERSLRSGMIDAREYDRRLTGLLKHPEAALEVTTYTPPRQTTDALLNELKALHKKGILTDDEFDERKSELFFERGVDVDPDEPAVPGDEGAAKQKKFLGYLDELLEAGVLDTVAYETAKTRLN